METTKTATAESVQLPPEVKRTLLQALRGLAKSALNFLRSKLG